MSGPTLGDLPDAPQRAPCDVGSGASAPVSPARVPSKHPTRAWVGCGLVHLTLCLAREGVCQINGDWPPEFQSSRAAVLMKVPSPKQTVSVWQKRPHYGHCRSPDRHLGRPLWGELTMDARRWTKLALSSAQRDLLHGKACNVICTTDPPTWLVS